MEEYQPSLNVQVKKILSMDPWIASRADVLMHDKPKNVCVGLVILPSEKSSLG